MGTFLDRLLTHERGMREEIRVLDLAAGSGEATEVCPLLLEVVVLMGYRQCSLGNLRDGQRFPSRSRLTDLSSLLVLFPVRPLQQSPRPLLPRLSSPSLPPHQHSEYWLQIPTLPSRTKRALHSPVTPFPSQTSLPVFYLLLLPSLPTNQAKRRDRRRKSTISPSSHSRSISCRPTRNSGPYSPSSLKGQNI